MANSTQEFFNEISRAIHSVIETMRSSLSSTEKLVQWCSIINKMPQDVVIPVAFAENPGAFADLLGVIGKELLMEYSCYLMAALDAATAMADAGVILTLVDQDGRSLPTDLSARLSSHFAGVPWDPPPAPSPGDRPVDL